ncbi:MAG: SAM-dependent methyltransferase [Clostridiales bacterium]|nr:SAM-dependent methyltransferase [Clostridiales bacterium]
MLSARLAALARWVPIGSKLADIGTDHGLLPVYLAKNGVISKGIAVDVSDESLKKARSAIKVANLEEILETRVGWGLKVIRPKEVDTVVIAGMGGPLIKSILEEGHDVLSSISLLILQPMNAVDVVRRWLVKNHFSIGHEELVRDGRYIYEIVIAKHGYQKVANDLEYEIGFKLKENSDPLFKEFVQAKVERARGIIDKLKDMETENAKVAMNELVDKVQKYEEVLKCYVL